MKKDNIILFAGCALIVGGSLILSKVLFESEKVDNTPEEVVTSYVSPTESTYNGATRYTAPYGYTLDYMEDDIICVNKTPRK